MKKKFSNHFHYSWWKYCLTLVLFVCVWVIIFNTLGAPKKNEKLRIAFFGDDFSSTILEETLKENITSLSSQSLKKISVENLGFTNSIDYHNLLATRSYGGDIIIITESYMQENIGDGYFKPLPIEGLKTKLGSLTYYEEDGDAYAILVDPTNENIRLKQYYQGNEKCYIFFSYRSQNIGGIYGSGKAEDDVALAVVKYLLEVRHE